MKRGRKIESVQKTISLIFSYTSNVIVKAIWSQVLSLNMDWKDDSVIKSLSQNKKYESYQNLL